MTMNNINESDILYIVMPAFNEAKNLPYVIEEWYQVIKKHSAGGMSRLVVVNDGSTDDTELLGIKYMRKFPQFVMLTKKNGGHGDTVLYGYRYAIDSGADYIFQTDSDGQTDPREFDAFWNNRRDYVAVIGDRQSTRQDGKVRIFIENIVRMLLRVTWGGIKIPDANAPFRLMRSDILDKYIKFLPEHYNLPNIMLTTYLVYYQEPIKFMRISFKQRKLGKNTVNIGKIIKIGLAATKDFVALKKEDMRRESML